MSRYSHSQIQSFLTCPRKYCYEKVEKIKPEQPTESLHLTLGTSVHGTLERLYKQVSDMLIPSKEESLKIFDDTRNDELTQIIKRQGKQPFDNPTIAIFYNRGKTYINRYYDTYKTFNEKIPMKMEENISFSLTDDISFSGKIDRLDLEGDTCVIVDYKTNKSLPKDGHDTIKDQITMYGLGIKNDYGSKIRKILGKVIYLHLQREVEWEITDEEVALVKEKYLQTANEIEKKKIQYNNGDKEIFKPTPCFACENCIFKQICPIYAHGFQPDEEISLGELGTTTIRSLIDEYRTISEKYKDLEGQKDLYAKMLVEFANQHGYKNLKGNDTKLSIVRRSEYYQNPEKANELQKKLQDSGVLDEVLAIDRNKLSKEFKENKLSINDYKDEIIIKNIEYIGRSSKLKDKEIEEMDDEIGE